MNRSLPFWRGSVMIVTLCCMGLLPIAGWGENVSSPPAKQTNGENRQEAPAPARRVTEVERNAAGQLTPAKEKAALKFVEQHHPELSELLSLLKEGHKQKYRVAVLEISRVSERLNRMREKMLPRYELELQIWKNNSRLNLLIASLPMSGDKDVTLGQIKVLLEQKYDLELQLLTFEMELARKRLERMEQTFTRLRSQQHEAIDRQLERLSRQYGPTTDQADRQESKRARDQKSSSGEESID